MAKLKPSRIRREPLRLESDSAAGKARKRVRRSDEEETWLGVAGVLTIAGAIAFVTLGIAIFTFTRETPPDAAKARLFRQCDRSEGPNCVIAGDTISVGGVRIAIDGLETPQIQGARCPGETAKGYESIVTLIDILNSGKVTVSPAFADKWGRMVRTVAVNDRDVRYPMIDAGAARAFEGKRHSWC